MWRGSCWYLLKGSKQPKNQWQKLLETGNIYINTSRTSKCWVSTRRKMTKKTTYRLFFFMFYFQRSFLQAVGTSLLGVEISWWISMPKTWREWLIRRDLDVPSNMVPASENLPSWLGKQRWKNMIRRVSKNKPNCWGWMMSVFFWMQFFRYFFVASIFMQIPIQALARLGLPQLWLIWLFGWYGGKASHMEHSLNGGTPISHPKMIILSRKTHGCWVPPFLGNTPHSSQVESRIERFPWDVSCHSPRELSTEHFDVLKICELGQTYKLLQTAWLSKWLTDAAEGGLGWTRHETFEATGNNGSCIIVLCLRCCGF